MKQILEAESVEELSIEELRAEFLKRIPRFEINNGFPLFKRYHVREKRPICIGVIGLTGEGKTGTASVIGLIDTILDGQPLWSNLNIRCEFKVSDDIARKYGGYQGGIASFESLPLDRRKLFRFDPEYHDGAILLDEINIEYAEARRSTSNVNLWFNEVDQQRRHLNLDIFYTVIHEMWVDPRLREMTDIFIKCEDPALDEDGLKRKITLGKQVRWTIYPMTRILTGHSYYETHKPLAPRYMHLNQFWGLFDTRRSQSKGGVKYAFQLDDEEPAIESDMSVNEDSMLQQEKDEWAWLDEALHRLAAGGVREISKPDLFTLLNVPRDMRRSVSTEMLYKPGVKVRQSGSLQYYTLPEFNLETVDFGNEREAVGAAF